MRELFVTNQFKKDFLKIPVFVRKDTSLVAGILRNNPLDKSLNTKKLAQISPPVWRVRVGAYRLIYVFNNNSVTLLRIRHRRDVYRNL